MREMIELLEQRRRAALDEAAALAEALAVLKRREGKPTPRTPGGAPTAVSERLAGKVLGVVAELAEPRPAEVIAEAAGTSATTVRRVAQQHPEAILTSRMNGGSRRLQYEPTAAARARAMAEAGE